MRKKKKKQLPSKQVRKIESLAINPNLATYNQKELTAPDFSLREKAPKHLTLKASRACIHETHKDIVK